MKPGVIREEYIAIIMRELLKGLDYLHTEGKLHRDIKGQYSLSLDWTNLTHWRKLPTFCCRRVGKLSLPISVFLVN